MKTEAVSSKTKTGQQNIDETDQSQSTFDIAWTTLINSPKFMISSSVILFFVIIAVFADLISPFHYAAQNLERVKETPGLEHFLGTDLLGRDMLSRMVHGARVSIFVGVSVVMMEFTLALALGLSAGYYGGIADTIILRSADVTFAFPPLFFAILIVATLGPSLINILIALTITGWPEGTRIVRAETLRLREKEFIESAHSAGLPVWRILQRHFIPNLISVVMVAATMKISRVIIAESVLSFLGIGIQPPTPSWGSMIYETYEYMQSDAYLTLIPGTGMVLLVLAFNFMGEGLRDALDPRLARLIRGRSRRRFFSNTVKAQETT
jgi:peptide/nickel transport system permease protein